MNKTLGLTLVAVILAGCQAAGNVQVDRYITDGETSCGTSSTRQASGSADVDLSRLRALAAGADMAKFDAMAMPEEPVESPAQPNMPPNLPTLTAPGEIVWLWEGKCGGIIWRQE